MFQAMPADNIAQQMKYLFVKQFQRFGQRVDEDNREDLFPARVAGGKKINQKWDGEQGIELHIDIKPRVMGKRSQTRCVLSGAR